MAVYPPRSKVAKSQTWNAESVFKNQKAWQAELNRVLGSLDSVKQFQGRLAEGPATLLEALNAYEQLVVRAERVYMYAGFAYAVDTTNQQASGSVGKAANMLGQLAAAVAFLSPEIIFIGRGKLDEWMKQEPKLALYAHSIDNLLRKQAHIRSAEVEGVLGMLADPFSGPPNTASMILNADFKFCPAENRAGKRLAVTQSSIHQILSTADRKARQTAWNNYMDRHVEFKNTLASNLSTAIKANVFQMRAHRHDSSLAASLFENNVPVDVFHSLIDTFKRKLPIWHRYFELRRKALGQSSIAYYDMWAPLGKRDVKITFKEAVEMICAGLEPMGHEYTEAIRKGCLEQRWVDYAPNKGKQNGAFSYGAPGTHPFIMMSFTGDVGSMSTLAHELGHSMHSYLTWKHQPLAYAEYSLFVAEVASNFHQAMVRAHLLSTTTNRNFQIALIEEAMSNFFRYFFQMPTLARFELETHERAEKGEALTA
ncbi:MAG TPA: M3 family oligoendopeptidase, partial [Anaerolineales bacterium]